MWPCQHLDVSLVKLMLDFWPTELKDNASVLFNVIMFMVICYGSNRKLMYTFSALQTNSLAITCTVCVHKSWPHPIEWKLSIMFTFFTLQLLIIHFYTWLIVYLIETQHVLFSSHISFTHLTDYWVPAAGQVVCWVPQRLQSTIWGWFCHLRMSNMRRNR